ncbi:MAG: DNA helicase RecQ [Muribaculaceae bacterium]|nr:DNA helicase RecQ [Muribaculaceae bacterium]
MNTAQDIHEALKQHFGFDKFKGDQKAIIESLLKGEDVFVLMPTGGGKSLCYQLPALMSEGTAIVISPLIALMKNQVDAIRHYGANDGIAHFLNSSLTRKEVTAVKKDVRAGITKLLYVAPESLSKEENVKFFKSINISFFAIDEAHCISEWGHDFRPEYRKIRPMISMIGNYPVIALTATATPKVQHDIQKNLGILKAKVFKSSFNRPNLYYEVRPKTKDVDRDIIRYIKTNPQQSGIIYCLSRKKVEELAETLRINGISCLPYHAGMEPAKRSENQDAFLQEKVDIIVATIAFGMGIDKPDVRFVIHYDIPKSLEGYYQETGRAGRDGEGGRCITFYSSKDLQKLDKLMQSKTSSEQEISRQLLMETAGYAESSVCRRKILLHYFGEEYKEENCGCCDNCTYPRKEIEASEELAMALELILFAGEKYKQEYIGNLLIGRCTDEVKTNGDEQLELFGCLKEYEEKLCMSLLRQAVIGGYLERDLESYGVLKLTEAGRKFIEEPTEFKIVEDRDYTEIDSEPQVRTGVSCVADPELYAMLRDLRKQKARKLDLPPYVIFQDPSLEAMATTYPVTEEELLSIPGVGLGKAQRYGKDFLELIKRHVEENEIIRPEDIRVRAVPKKNNLKVAIIQAIDRKIDLEELAEGKGLEFPELIDELESIVESGTKIDIDYYIYEEMDEDLVNDIEDFFREQEEDNIEEAIQELGDEADEDKIRLVRVKFLSEMGN